jgi:hypothetical protein
MMRYLGGALATVGLLLVRPALADEEGVNAARAYFRPKEPWALVSLSGGVGGFFAAQSTTPKGQLDGNGGLGMLAARIDVEAPSPLWLSLAGRTFVGTPAEAEVDASVGYNFRFYWQEDSEKRAFDRFELRPLVGIKAIRAADSVTVPTSTEVNAARFGGDLLFQSSASVKGAGAFELHLVGLWDVARAQTGVDFEIRDTYAIRAGTLDGIFLALGGGYLPSIGGYGQLELGVSWELGRR